MTSHYVYVLKCKDETLYTGYTTNLKRRFIEHNTSIKGAKYTRGRRPVEMVHFETFITKSDALKWEHQFKKLKKHQKLNFIMACKNIVTDTYLTKINEKE